MDKNNIVQSEFKQKLQEKIQKKIVINLLERYAQYAQDEEQHEEQLSGNIIPGGPPPPEPEESNWTDFLEQGLWTLATLYGIPKLAKWGWPIAKKIVPPVANELLGQIGSKVTGAARLGMRTAATGLGTAARMAVPYAAPVAAAAAGTAVGTGLAYGANRAMDAIDTNTWKTGGSRAKTQVDLLTGDSDTWGKVGGAVVNPMETIQSLLASSSVGPVARYGADLLTGDVIISNYKDKIRVKENNPNIRKGQQYVKDVDKLWNETKTRLGKRATDEKIASDKVFKKKMAELRTAAE